MFIVETAKPKERISMYTFIASAPQLILKKSTSDSMDRLVEVMFWNKNHFKNFKHIWILFQRRTQKSLPAPKDIKHSDLFWICYDSPGWELDEHNIKHEKNHLLLFLSVSVTHHSRFVNGLEQTEWRSSRFFKLNTYFANVRCCNVWSKGPFKTFYTKEVQKWKHEKKNREIF